MGKYYFKVTEGMCLEQCPIFEKIFIGTFKCEKCKNNQGRNIMQNFVYCEHLSDNENPLLQEIIELITSKTFTTPNELAERILEWHFKNK